MRITISGMPGSGKSTIAKFLAEKFKLKYFYIGKMQRDIATKMNISVLELARLEEKDKKIDEEIDNYQKNLSTKENIIVDSRIGFHFIPNSIKIFLKVDIDEGVKRISELDRGAEKFKNKEEAKKKIIERMESESKRYKQYYGIEDFRDPKNYDFVLDTTNLSIPEVQKKVLEFVENFTAQ